MPQPGLTTFYWEADQLLPGEPIPFVGSGSIKFPGMRIQVPHDVTASDWLSWLHLRCSLNPCRHLLAHYR